jgi:hypothetical protein
MKDFRSPFMKYFHYLVTGFITRKPKICLSITNTDSTPSLIIYQLHSTNIIYELLHRKYHLGNLSISGMDYTNMVEILHGLE